MFDTRFNNGYVGSNGQYPNMQQNPNYPYASYNPQDPYAANNQDRLQMQNIPYPIPPTEGNSGPVPEDANYEGYAKGGEVKKKKGSSKQMPYSILAEMVRQQGKGEDTILAHINPLEAMMLKSMGGSGTINKDTGLPQFGLFSNPGKWFKSVLGPAGGAILGNMILPGLGGVIGGAVGGAAGSAVRGRKDHMQSALRGLGMGAMLPTAAGLLGSGLNSLGATGAGGALTGYGERNAILPALGNMFGSGGNEATVLSSQANMPHSVFGSSMLPSGLSGASGQAASGAASAGAGGASGSWYNQLLGNTGNYLSKPKNLLTLAAVGSSMLNRPKQEKPKTPEQVADEAKRLEKALRLSPEERAAKEAELIAEAQMQRSIAMNKFLPKDRMFNLEPIHRKSHTPEEQKRHGRWFSYYTNKDFNGEPMPFAAGGNVPNMMFEAEAISPSGLGQYIQGETKGQADKINALLSDGEFVVPSDVVADLGDGNNAAGAEEFYKLINNVRKHKRGGSVKLPPKAKPLSAYLKGAKL